MRFDRTYKSSGLTFFGIAASEVIDSSAEVIDIDGCDISDFEKGVGQFNFEHMSDKDVHEGKVAPGQNWVGRVVYAKKILQKTDCDNELEEKCWDSVQSPFIFTIGRLYDSAGHPGSQALAAIMRDAHRNGEKNIVRMSIEGSTLLREENVIKQCVAKNIALTVRPCNKTCDTWVLYDPNAPKDYEKNPEKFNTDVLKDIAKEVSKALALEELEPLSKEERTEAKAAIKAMAMKKIAQQQDPLVLFKKLLPIYQANAAQCQLPALDDSSLNFIQCVKNAPITINFSPSKLLQLVQDGRFKNQFESTNQYDRVDRDERKLFENKVFGVPLNAANRNRPVYGSLHLGHEDPERSPEGGAPMYGSAFLVLKPELKDRSSFTHNDSFVVGPEQVLPAQALDKVAVNYITDPDKSDFVEVQIHGGVDFSKDIEYLCVPEDPRTDGYALTFGQKFNVPVYAYDDAGNKKVLYDNTPPISPVFKTITAGNYNVAPSQLTGGAALQIEDAGLKKQKIKKLVEKAFEKTGLEKTKENFKAFLKAALPELTDDYLDFFEEAQEPLDIPKSLVRKAEYLSIEIKKALHGISLQKTEPADQLQFNGKNISPGTATVNGALHYLVDETPDAFIGARHDAPDLSESNLIKLPKQDAGQVYALHAAMIPSQPKTPLVAHEHGSFPFNMTPEQHELINGLEVGSDDIPEDGKWCSHPTQGRVFVKPFTGNDTAFAQAQRELAYHNLANNFFGLGGNVPRMAVFLHPDNGNLHVVQKGLNDVHHSGVYSHRYDDVLRANAMNGDLEKMLFMDHVMGNSGRHGDNYMHSPSENKIYFMNHGASFESPESNLAKDIHGIDPTFLSTPSHAGMLPWVQAMNKKDLHKQLVFNQVPVNKTKEAMARFNRATKHIAGNGPGKVY